MAITKTDEIVTPLNVDTSKLKAGLKGVEVQADKSLGDKGAAGSAGKFADRVRVAKTDVQKLDEQIAKLNKQTAFNKLKGESQAYQNALRANQSAIAGLNGGLTATGRAAGGAGISLNSLRGGMTALASPMASLSAGGGSFTSLAAGASSFAAALGPVGIAVGAGVAAFSLLQPFLGDLPSLWDAAAGSMSSGTPILAKMTASIDLQKIGVNNLDDALRDIARGGMTEYIAKLREAKGLNGAGGGQIWGPGVITDTGQVSEERAAQRRADALRSDVGRLRGKSALQIAGEDYSSGASSLSANIAKTNELADAIRAEIDAQGARKISTSDELDQQRAKISGLKDELSATIELSYTLTQAQTISDHASKQRDKDKKEHDAAAKAAEKEAAALRKLRAARLSVFTGALAKGASAADRQGALGQGVASEGSAQWRAQQAWGMSASIMGGANAGAGGVASDSGDLAAAGFLSGAKSAKRASTGVIDEVVEDMKKADAEMKALTDSMASTITGGFGAAFASVATGSASMNEVVLGGMGDLITQLAPALTKWALAQSALFSGNPWLAIPLTIAMGVAGALLKKAGTPSPGQVKGASGSGNSQAVERAIARASERDAAATRVEVYLNGKVDKMFDVIEGEAVRRGYPKRSAA